MSDKKPDNVADSPNILPYGSNVGAPSIVVENIEAWKQPRIIKVNKQFQSKFNELKEEYQRLIDEYKWNDLVYQSKFSFEPVVGETYHLYYGNDGNVFLNQYQTNLSL
jgi:hypothetical protein